MEWNRVQAVFQGTLTEVNVEAEKVDEKLAKKIDDGEIDGVMFVSAVRTGRKQTGNGSLRKNEDSDGPERAEVVSRSRRTWDVMFCQHLEQQEQTNRTRAVAFTTATCKKFNSNRYLCNCS